MAKLYFRYGAMGSSKSANILMVRYNYEERGQYAVLLKPRTDNRDGEHEIKSRIGLEAPAEYVDEFLKEISETWSADSGEYRYHGKKVDAVLIDEAQFLSPEQVDQLARIVDNFGHRGFLWDSGSLLRSACGLPDTSVSGFEKIDGNR